LRYGLLKIYVRLLLKIFCFDIKINNRRYLKLEGPLLITANHPNSFFDALLVATHFKKSIFFLARGDVFKNDRVAGILRWLRMIPIHRISEGVENLHLNQETFDICRKIFRNNGILLIFIEGLSQHEWSLRPFKKGAARLALSSWSSTENENRLQVLPMGITYSDYNGLGKKVFIEISPPLSKENFDEIVEDGKAIVSFNEKLYMQISDLIIDVKNNNEQALKNILVQSDTAAEARFNLLNQTYHEKKMLSPILLLPAVIGFIFHAPLYFPIKAFVNNKTKATVFFDSVLFGLLLIIYPFYLLLIVGFIYMCTASLLSLLVLFVLPLCARAAAKYFALQKI
jgi:1-acyl-sn-glycerol-3-phosphate acyltransferase